jgi:MoaA/NifB/PqqE/SkfB family radical SAM enzyme
MSSISEWIQSKKALKFDSGQSLCLYPFFNVMMNANGTYKPCCKWSEVLEDEQGRPLEASSKSLGEAFHSGEMDDLRRAFLKGNFPKKCSVCWDEESKNIQSMRRDSFDYLLDKSILKDPSHPLRLDLYMSNLCNLKCRICSADYSSKWIAEAKETQGIEASLQQNLTDANFEEIKTWLPKIIELGLFGGEPLYLKSCRQLLEYCVQNGYSQHIKLLINTNGTIYDDELLDLLLHFKKVLLNFSLDDIAERFEYQRKGAVWADTISNVRSFLSKGGFEHRDKLECKVCCTVSSLNIYYLPEFFQEIQREFTGMPVYLNFLHGPYSLSARNLPTEIKALVKSRIQKFRHLYDLKFDQNHTRTIENIFDFLDLSPTEAFSSFFKEIDRGDAYRNEKFSQIFPEFYALILPYRAEI